MKRRALMMVTGLVLALAAGACQDTTKPDGGGACLQDTDCGQPGVLCCKGNTCLACNQPCPNPCTADAECATLGQCMVCQNSCCGSLACDSDDDCPPDGAFQRLCGVNLDPELGCRVCEYVRCTEDAQCTDPTFPLYIANCEGGGIPVCKNGLCECGSVCGGECPSGQFCCTSSRTCLPNPDPCPGVSCEACYQPNPNPGGGINPSTCVYEGADCSCQPMPPLEPAFGGQHSALAMRPDGRPVISGYYAEPYGDLIVGVASSAAAGATVDWEFVDGVPAEAPCTGASDGPRNGIAEPGPDVGWETDIVVDAQGNPRVSYYDRSSGDLKYAAYNGSIWMSHVVDGKGNTGRFSSIVLDAQGLPIIAYMTTRDNRMSSLRIAKASVPNPRYTEDWMVSIVDSAPISCLPDECRPGKACLKATGQCAVTQDAAFCANGAGCEAKFVCVSGTCMEERGNPVADFIPEGVGLFASLALYANNSPAIAYYDSTNGNLKFAYYNPGTSIFATPVVLDGDTTNRGADASMVIGAGDTVHIAYQDADLGDLYYLTFQGVQVAGKTIELVDAGARDANGVPTTPGSAVGGFHWVGNFASIVLDSAGAPRIAYQDGTSEDLCYALRFGGSWSVEVLAKKQSGAGFTGAYGFFADQVISGGMAVISNFKHNLRTQPYSSGIDLRTR